MSRDIGAHLRSASAWIALGLLAATFADRLIGLPAELRLERALAQICGPQGRL